MFKGNRVRQKDPNGLIRSFKVPLIFGLRHACLMLHDGPERLRGQAANLCHSGDPLHLLLRRGRIEHNLLPRDIPGPLATELHRFFAGQDAVEEAGMDGQEEHRAGIPGFGDSLSAADCLAGNLIFTRTTRTVL